MLAGPALKDGTSHSRSVLASWPEPAIYGNRRQPPYFTRKSMMSRFTYLIIHFYFSY
jgi:hypothetical protein